MNCTLQIGGDKKIENPTEADIRQAVFSLDVTKGDPFLVLSPTEMTYIQIYGDYQVGFDLEYQETDVKHHYRAKRRLGTDEIVKALFLYSTGSGDWKRMAEWQRVEL